MLAFCCLVWFFSSFHRHIFFVRVLVHSFVRSFPRSLVRLFVRYVQYTRKRVLRKSTTHSQGVHTQNRVKKKLKKKEKKKFIETSGKDRSLAAGILIIIGGAQSIWHFTSHILSHTRRHTNSFSGRREQTVWTRIKILYFHRILLFLSTAAWSVKQKVHVKIGSAQMTKKKCY